ncbi:hypothetical protein JOF53_001504 [Crossiella equi]|uniref:DUF5666 domain-containing protein n=1 Tax=Crossiella equi TaxID=130796 RepID=A0ABS5A8L6_9PSEU|nr:DUF5666 domain-containing protein [Crossiella equi]MBP2472632.1 hypothetical protein [Crossiella equi]
MTTPDPEQVLATPVDEKDLGAQLTEAGKGPSRLTLGLAAAALAAVAFAGGLWASAAFGGDTAVAGPGARGGGAGGFGGGARPSGAPQAPGGGGGARGGTVGTVDRVEGDTLYLKTANGTEVRVKISADTPVNLTEPGKVADLKPGDSVSVQGERAQDGSVTARQLTEQAPPR